METLKYFFTSLALFFSSFFNTTTVPIASVESPAIIQNISSKILSTSQTLSTSSIVANGSAINQQQETKCLNFGVGYPRGSEQKVFDCSIEIRDIPTDVEVLYKLKNKTLYKVYSSSTIFQYHDPQDKNSINEILFTNLVDASFFKILWADELTRYISYRNKIYINEDEKPEIDAESFVPITKDVFPVYPNSGNNILHYSKDKNHVYYDGVVIANADSDTFKAIWAGAMEGEHVYAKDKNYVYYMGNIMAGADPGSIKVLTSISNGWRVGGGYSIDSKNVYFENSIINEADPKSFEADLEGDYAFDRDRVYLNGKVLPGENPKYFTFPVSEGP